ncbi:MAG: class I SAM-dependent methyltransferase, partial [bacterium]|nr:class I SAM-dependent methyltransferase [bacterium]
RTWWRSGRRGGTVQALLPAADAAHAGRLLARHAGTAVVDCAACGFAHLDPLPDAASLRETYRRHYYDAVKPDYLARESSEQGFWQLEYDDKLDAIAALRGGRRGRLLDVGCSGGFFLAHARRRGWDGLGLEPSAQAAAHARDLGVPVIEAFFEDADWAGLGRFAAVHLKLVLEHLADPAALLRRAREVLLPDGVLCLQVPNDFNALQAVVQETLAAPPWWVAPPYHVNYFDFASLGRLCARTGFAVREQSTNFPMELFLLMGEHYVGDDRVGRACHQRRMALDARLAAAGRNDLRRAAYAALAAAGLGREVIVWAQPMESA